VVIAVLGGGVWFLFLREKPAPQNDTSRVGSASVAKPVAPSPAPAGSNATPPASESGSGSAMPAAAGSRDAPKQALVDTVIASSADKAAIAVVDTDQKGAAPFTAKLEQDKPYKVRATAAGFLPIELDVKGGQAGVTAKLVAKPRTITVATDPPGALILLDNGTTGNITPYEIALTKAQAVKKTVKITVRKAGFRPVEKVIALEAYQETDTRMVAKVEAKLEVAPIQRPAPQPPRDPNAGSGAATPADAGSATPDAAKPTPTPPPATPPADTAKPGEPAPPG
jgi:hypothetical protein